MSITVNTLSQVTEALAGTYTGFDAGAITKRFGDLLSAVKKAEDAADDSAAMLVEWGVRPENLSNDKRYRHASGENRVNKLLQQLMIDTYRNKAQSAEDRKFMALPAKSLSEDDAKKQSKLKSAADNFIRSALCGRMAKLLTEQGDDQYARIAADKNAPRGAQQPDGHINSTGKQPKEVVDITCNSMIGYLQKQEDVPFDLTKVVDLFNQIKAELAKKAK